MTPTQIPGRTADRARPAWLSDAAFPFTSRWLDIDGDDIHYIDEGAGPALLLVNVGMWSFVFRDLAVRLRAHFRVIALDFPGMGLTTARRPLERTVAQQSTTLEHFIDALDLQDITLLVHDVGGPVGLGYAARHPERIHGLIVANTFAFPLAHYPVIRGMLGLVGSRSFDALNTRTNVFARVSATAFGVGRHLDSTSRRAFLGPWHDRDARRASVAALRSVRNVDSWLEQIEQALTTTLADRPLLSVYGARNDPFGWQDRMRRMFPRGRHLRVPGANHFPFADAPDMVADEIVLWWRDEAGQGGSAVPSARAEVAPTA